MTKQEMINKVRAVNGAYNWLVLNNKIEEAQAVIEKHLAPSPFPLFAAHTEDDLAQSAASALTGIVARTFCVGVSRQDALFILRLLTVCKSLTVCGGVEFDDFTFRSEWNACHADDEKIFAEDYRETLSI